MILAAVGIRGSKLTAITVDSSLQGMYFDRIIVSIDVAWEHFDWVQLALRTRLPPGKELEWV